MYNLKVLLTNSAVESAFLKYKVPKCPDRCQEHVNPPAFRVGVAGSERKIKHRIGGR